MPRLPVTRHAVPVTARVLRVLEAGPVTTSELQAALPDIAPVSLRTAIWKLREAGIVSKRSPRYQYELAEEFDASAQRASVQLLRLDPVGRMLLTICDGSTRVSKQLTEGEAAQYARELMDFARGQRKSGVSPRRKHSPAE